MQFSEIFKRKEDETIEFDIDDNTTIIYEYVKRGVVDNFALSFCHAENREDSDKYFEKLHKELEEKRFG